MLIPALAGKVAALRGTDLGENLVILLELQTELGQIPFLFLGGKDLVYPGIGPAVPGKAGAMAAVVSDIERLISLRSLAGRLKFFGTDYVVVSINAVRVSGENRIFAGLVLRKGGKTDKQGTYYKEGNLFHNK
jgi:hypothetical protein